jgi:peptidoglycan/LPS O-acetylase OafA/YrhL
MPLQTLQPKPSRVRLSSLDTFRFIAAASVVLYHFEDNFRIFGAFKLCVLSQFHLMVDFFFVLSGFVLMHTYEGSIINLNSYGDFLRKRIARIYPLHLAVTLLFLAASLLVAAGYVSLRMPEYFDWRLGPSHLLLVHAWGFTHPGLNFPSWSISAEFFVYFLFPFLASMTLRIGPSRSLAVAAGVALVMTLFREYLGLRPWTQATHDYGMLRAVPTFLAGIACNRLVTKYRIRCSWSIAYSVAIVTALSFFAGLPDSVVIALFPILVTVTAAAQMRSSDTVLSHPFLVHLGDASYGVYMLHTPVIFACLALVRRLGLTSGGQLIAVAIFGLIVTTGLALVSFRWFETPARRWISGIKR